jgi:hypothetical protein
MEKSVSDKQDFSDEIIDVEEYAKAGKELPPQCHAYRIRIDKQKYVVTRPALTGSRTVGTSREKPARAISN